MVWILYLGTGLFSNINSVKIPEFLLYFLQAYNLTLLCSLIVVLSSSKLLYIFLQNRFAAFLAANFSKQFVELYLGSKRNVTRNDDSVVMARIFFGDIQVWASDFCQKIVTIFERSLFLLISLAYFVLYLPIYSIGLVGVFALISVFFVKVIQNKNENVGRELRFFSDKLMVFGEKIADGILEIKSSKSIAFFSAHYFEAYIKFAKGRAHAALLKNIPGIITTGFGQIALVLTPLLLVGLGYGKSDVTAAFIILGIILSRAVPVIGSISTDITTIFNNMPTLERLVILINRYKENQEKGLWIKGKPPVVENESNIDLLVHLKNIQASYGSDIIFKSVNLVLKSGNIYGFTGASGSGKSTLSSVIAGLTSSTDGTIRYTDQFGNEVLPEISIAPQEAILFDGSFQMNIGMGNDFDMEIASKFIKSFIPRKN